MWITCLICRETVEGPKILPCIHAFCEECLKQKIEENGENATLLCPVCNTESSVPDGGVTGFESNVLVAHTSKSCSNHDSELVCAFCKLQETVGIAESICVTCTDPLCESCAQAHCKTKVTFNHQVISLEDFQNGTNLDDTGRSVKVYCSVHADAVVQLFCLQCLTPMCLLCAVFEHKGHKKLNMEEAVTEVNDAMRQLLDRWELVKKHSEDLSVERKQVLSELDEQEANAIQKLEKTFEVFMREISLKKSRHFCRLQEEVSKVREQANMAYDDAEARRALITDSMGYAQKILDSVKDIEKLQQFRDIKTCFEFDVRQLPMEVLKPVITLLSEEPPIPDFKIKFVTELKQRRVSPCLSEQPTSKEKACLVRHFSTRIHGEDTVNCSGLGVSDDWFVIADIANKRVKVFARATGSFVFEVDQTLFKLQMPTSVAWGSDMIFVTDDGIHGVVCFNERGELVKIVPNMYSVSGCINCHNSQLFISDFGGERIVIADHDCTVKSVIDKSTLGLITFTPWGMCADSEGHLVVCDHKIGRILVIDHNLQKLIRSTVCWGRLWFCDCADEWDNILIVDDNKNQVVLMSNRLQQECVPITRDDVRSPIGLFVTNPGEVAVLERYTGNLKIFQYLD